MNNIYKFAEKYILIDSLYPDVHNYYSNYRADNSPDLCVKISQADIDNEREKSETFSTDGWLEISAVHRKIAELREVCMLTVESYLTLGIFILGKLYVISSFFGFSSYRFIYGTFCQIHIYKSYIFTKLLHKNTP